MLLKKLEGHNRRYLKFLRKPEKSFIQTLNESVAVHITMIFGTMWTCYAFFFYGFLPIMFPRYMNTFLYWSNTVQLWSLPLLMVGQSVMGRASEIRAQETYEAEIQEIGMIKQDLNFNKEQQAEMQHQQKVILIEIKELKEKIESTTKNH